MKLKAQPIPLPATWKFMEEDVPNFKEANYNDKHWQNVNVNDVWLRPALLKPQTIGWYRVSFDLPSSDISKELVLLLGNIDDADETYFNGVRIGSSGKFPPNTASAWDVQRNYKVKKELVKKHNVLAIRVHNGTAVGGILAGTGTYNATISYMLKNDFNAFATTFMKDRKSYHQLTTSNGLIAAVYNFKEDKVENVFPHIFAYYDSNQLVKPFIQNIRLQNAEKPISATYKNNSHVIEVTYKNFSITYFASFTTEEKIFYAIIKGLPKTIKNISFDYDKSNADIIVEQFFTPTEKIFLFSFNDELHKNNASVLQAKENYLTKNNNILGREIKFMLQVFATCSFPMQIKIKEKNLAEQSVSFLKMSQVSDKEIFPLSHGQVLASLRPGVWSISWVRDASFAIEAMTKIGMHNEAKKGLEFMLKANPTDQYINYIHNDGKDYGIGVPYQISVTRYFGNGREESDFDERGPNIELDNFGLFLTAFAVYINQTTDTVFYTKWNDIIINKVCAAIIHNIGTDNILRQDSGPWEHHLPGKQFIFTNAVCAKGLEDIIFLQKKYNLSFKKIEEAYEKMYLGIQQNFLVNNNYYKGNTQNKLTTDHHYYDGATFEIFANGLINNKQLFLSHMKEYNKILRASDDAAKGYIRFRSKDSYENQEWPFAGLRVAIAQNKFGNKKEAKKLIDRITMFASKNYNAIPEIFSLEHGIYKGAIPMVGYGAGAYLLAILDYYKK